MTSLAAVRAAGFRRLLRAVRRPLEPAGCGEDAAAPAPAAPATRPDPLDPGVLAELERLEAAVPGALLPIVSFFATDSGTDLRAMDAALRRGDADAGAALAHRLKGSAANVAAGRVADLCRRIEDGLREGDLSGSQALLPALHDELCAAIAALRAVFLSERDVSGNTEAPSSRTQRPDSSPPTFRGQS